MFHKVQEYSFSNIDKFSTSSIVTRLTTDVTNVQQAFMMVIRVAIRAPLMMIISLIFAFQVNAKLSVMYLCAIPVLGIALFSIQRFAHPIFEKVFHIYDKLNMVVQENLSGIRVVKSFVREDHEVDKFSKVSKDIYKNFAKAEKIVAFNMPIMQFTMYVCMILASWFGAKLIVYDGMTTGALSSIISYAAMILSGLMMLSMVFVMIMISQASVERINELLDEKSTIVSPENPVMEVPDGSIEFDDVDFSYSSRADKLCLKDVNLKIKSGQTVGIIGGTGSSKSTLVQMIPRLYDATSGTVKVGGIDAVSYTHLRRPWSVSSMRRINVPPMLRAMR